MNISKIQTKNIFTNIHARNSEGLEIFGSLTEAAEQTAKDINGVIPTKEIFGRSGGYVLETRGRVYYYKTLAGACYEIDGMSLQQLEGAKLSKIA
jgi:hypothetical protein